jgi:two-component system cell cycle response regulator
MAHELPTPPAGLAMVIQAAGDPDVAMRKLVALISAEPSLTASLLGLANSAAYGARREMRSVQQATLVLGTRTIRNIAVSHAVRVASAKVDSGALDGLQFWEDSLRRGAAAMVLSREAGFEDPVEAFTVGLIQDLGILILAVRDAPASKTLQESMDIPASERIALERQLCGKSHAELFVEKAREWGLPEDIVQVVGHHHDENLMLEDRRNQRLLEICAVADAVADIVQTQATGIAVSRANAMLRNLTSRKTLSLEDILEQVRSAMADMSVDLNIRINHQPTFEELMSNANEALIQINLSYEELTKQLQETLKEKEELARQLRASNEALRRLAATDVLTGVANRRSFTGAMGEELEKLDNADVPLTLLIMDIDFFKKVNDTYGHAAGDDVLKAVCQRMGLVVRAEDLIARIGGEEFAILLRECPEDVGRDVAERLRVSIQEAPVRCRDGSVVWVSSSFGGITVQGSNHPTQDDLISQADQALYAAKEAGRDRVTWYE